MKRICFLLLSVTFFIAVCPTYASAADLPDEYDGFRDSLPEDVAEMLPEGFFSDDLGEVTDSVSNMLSPKEVLGLFRNLLSGGMPDAFALLSALICITVLSVLLDLLSDSFSSSGAKNVMAYISSLSLATAVAALQFPALKAAGAFFHRVCVMMNSFIPVMTALYIAGGNTGTAAVNASSLMIRLNIIELCATAIVMPAVCACIALTLADSLRTAYGSLSGIVSWIKHTLGFLFGLGSTLLMATLAAQNVIAAAGDNAGARAVKFLAGNMIPVVGSTVGDTLRTLAASVRLFRSTVGVAGMIALALLILPFLFELFLTRWALNSAAAIGQMIGGHGIARLCRELSSLYGYIIAAATLSSVLCVLSLTLFAIGSTAIGGLG